MKIDGHTAIIAGNFTEEDMKEILSNIEVKCHTVIIGNLAVEKYFEREERRDKATEKRKK